MSLYPLNYPLFYTRFPTALKGTIQQFRYLYNDKCYIALVLIRIKQQYAAKTQCLVRALVAIAEQFDMLTVVEHVERAEDAAMLTEIGIDCMQGYFIGAPSVQPPWINSATGGMSAQATA
jgi:EAL domain-containing protein (putative c-di-GMP-specific phosphodiesterase class I)